MDLYAALGTVMAAFDRAGLSAPVALELESERELEAFKYIFNCDLFPPDMVDSGDGVWFGDFQIRVRTL
ncbi:MAG: hypothetical protein COA69_13505 [Robiginitomaculum sp.]|nr:MAG: hypothetical protein COA69_13505 [Robiginitomaculum sp.]